MYFGNSVLAALKRKVTIRNTCESHDNQPKQTTGNREERDIFSVWYMHLVMFKIFHTQTNNRRAVQKLSFSPALYILRAIHAKRQQ